MHGQPHISFTTVVYLVLSSFILMAECFDAVSVPQVYVRWPDDGKKNHDNM